VGFEQSKRRTCVQDHLRILWAKWNVGAVLWGMGRGESAGRRADRRADFASRRFAVFAKHKQNDYGSQINKDADAEALNECFHKRIFLHIVPNRYRADDSADGRPPT